jgi:hypothetical protein
MIALSIGIIGLFAGLAILGWSAQKPSYQSLGLLSVAMLALLFVGFMIYASVRSNAPFSIVVWTIIIVSNLVWFGFFLIPLRDWPVFGRNTKRRRLIQFVGVSLSFTIIFAFAERGIWYALLAVIQPSAIPANPEIVVNVVPALAAILLIVFRLSHIVKIPPLSVVSRIAEDTIFASFALFLFVTIIQVLQVEPINLLNEITPNLPLGLLTGVIGLGIECVTVSVKDNLKHRYGSKYLESRLAGFFSLELLLSLFDRERQTELSDYTPPQEIRPRSSGSDKSLSFSIFGRRIRRSYVGGFAFVAIIVVWTIFNIPLRGTALVPGWQVNVAVVCGPLDSSSLVRLSDQIESTSPKRYLVPLVHVVEGHLSLMAPLNSRLVSVNSTNFVVIETGYYLSVNITEVPIVGVVETTPIAYVFSPNITASDEFSYRGLFRDAEIYYALFSLGYRSIVSLCNRLDSNELSTIFKTIYAKSTTGRYAVVSIYVEWELNPLNDTTLLRSPDSVLNKAITDLFSLAKISSDFHVEQTEPPIPFTVPLLITVNTEDASLITLRRWG